MTDGAGVHAVIADLDRRLGGIDRLVTNAGSGAGTLSDAVNSWADRL
ncbi:hypothetical protein [Nocardia xishanensis]